MPIDPIATHSIVTDVVAGLVLAAGGGGAVAGVQVYRNKKGNGAVNVVQAIDRMGEKIAKSVREEASKTRQVLHDNCQACRDLNEKVLTGIEILKDRGRGDMKK